MPTSVYISGHDPQEAAELANRLASEGLLIRSTWHDQKEGTSGFLPDEEKAGRNFPQIFEADVLVLVASPGLVTGGKFVEAGYAVGRGTSVVILGRRENGILASPTYFDQVDDEKTLVEYLENWGGC
jgi:hypothetical protein